jgi:hypothetical protein
MKLSKYQLILFLSCLFFGFLLSINHVAAATNLLTNPGHETGDNTGWTGSVTVKTGVEDCPDWPTGTNAQCVREAGPYSYYTVQTYEGSYALHFSYTLSTSNQTIDLTENYTNEYLDTAPDVDISDHVFGTKYVSAGCGDTYRLRVLLKDGSGGTIATYDTGSQTATCEWQTLSHTFSDYGSGVRSIYYERSSNDSDVQAGAHGAAFDSASVVVGDTYTLTYTSGNGGSISGSSTQSIDYGEDGTEVTAVPDTGYDFVQWSDGSTSTSRTDTNITTTTAYSASFTTSTYTLSYSTSTIGGYITGSSTQTIYYGENGAEVTAVPDTGYSFVSWSDGSTSTSRTDTNITTTTAYTSAFAINTYTLTYSAGTGGSVSGSSSQTVDYGSDGSAVTAVASNGYTFSQWSDGSTANPRTDTSMTSNVSVSASFTADPVPTGGGIFVPPSTPKVVIPPSFNNNSINSSVTNVYQMAISDSEDFFGVSWEDYNESYQTNDKILYIKFRSEDGGVSEVFVVEPKSVVSEVVEPTCNPVNYEDRLIKYNNSPKIYLVKNCQKRWIVDEEAFNYFGYDWAGVTVIDIEFESGENIIKPSVGTNFVFNRDLKLEMEGEDVRELQKYLNNNSFVLSPNGFPGSPGNETTLFGNATQNALIKFQQANNLPAYGYFGPMTRVIISY